MSFVLEIGQSDTLQRRVAFIPCSYPNGAFYGINKNLAIADLARAGGVFHSGGDGLGDAIWTTSSSLILGRRLTT